MIPLAIGFIWLRNVLDRRPIPWVTYSSADLDRYLAEGHIVLINFRANWALSSVVHEHLALETPNVRRWIRSHGVIAMRADFSQGSPEVAAALQTLGQVGVPAVAVYSAESRENPLVLSTLISEDSVLDALTQAEQKQNQLPQDRGLFGRNRLGKE